jgi:hypothetical protein
LIQNRWAPLLLVTWHPSAILRAITPVDRARLRQAFVPDLRYAAELIGSRSMSYSVLKS